MKRTALALLCSLALASPVFAQAKPATPETQPPPAKAKWVAPVKGLVTIDVIRTPPKKVGNDMVTVLKVKNTSDGAIALLRVDEYWYNDKREMISADTERVKKPIMPGEIVEITTKSPVKPGLYQNTYNFSHANGQVKATVVKKFSDK
jgi:hypothetical protein